MRERETTLIYRDGLHEELVHGHVGADVPLAVRGSEKPRCSWEQKANPT